MLCRRLILSKEGGEMKRDVAARSCPIAKTCVSVRHASALLPFGFEGVDDERDDPFSLKKKR